MSLPLFLSRIEQSSFCLQYAANGCLKLENCLIGARKAWRRSKEVCGSKHTPQMKQKSNSTMQINRQFSIKEIGN